MDDKPTHKSQSDSSNKEIQTGRNRMARHFMKGLGAASVAAPFVAIATKAAAEGPKIPEHSCPTRIPVA